MSRRLAVKMTVVKDVLSHVSTHSHQRHIPALSDGGQKQLITDGRGVENFPTWSVRDKEDDMCPIESYVFNCGKVGFI